MPRHLLLALVSLCVVFRALAAAHDPSYTITLFSVPGTPYTSAAINARGQIVGQYEVDQYDLGHGHGFLFDHGTFTTIDPPGGIETFPIGINIRGQIVGNYTDASYRIRGFLFDRGTFTPLDPPGADLTQVTGINDRSQIVGYYRDASVGYRVRGFLFDAGHFTVIDVPEAGFIEPQAINIWGQIVGVTGITQIVAFLATPTKP